MSSSVKKLMILGAGEAQLAIIKEAKASGIFTVVCDNRPWMEGSRIADSYHQTDYMDRIAILSVAEEEQIDGVISNSEPAMKNVAWLSEKMGLVGNPESAVDILLSKSGFRDLQRNAGLFSPKSVRISSVEELPATMDSIGFPLIIKPSQSSGTRGTTVMTGMDLIKAREAFEECASFSRDSEVVIEEYLEMDTLSAYDAEIFVLGDEILWDGMYASVRSEDAPMLPIMEHLPLDIPEEKKNAIKDAVSRLIKAAGIRHGEYNAEAFFTKTGECFVIEINPRQGGNHIPDLVYKHSGINFTRLLCETAVGDRRYYDSLGSDRENNPITMYVVFSRSAGKYEGLNISDTVRPFVIWSSELLKRGDVVSSKSNAGDAVAFVMMQFGSLDTQKTICEDIERYIYPIIKIS